MNDEVPERSLQLRTTVPELNENDTDLLAYDRPSWAWEFLRRNAAFRAAIKDQAPFKRHTRSHLTTIQATLCASEVRKFGICFC